MGAIRLREVASAIVAVVEPETSAQRAAQLMRTHHVGSLVVVDATDQTRAVGIVTDRDLVLALMAEGLDPAVFTVGDIMTVDLVSARPETDVLEAVELMRRHRLRRLVVQDENARVVGLAAMEDLLEVLAREMVALGEAMRGARDREFKHRA